MRALIRNLSVIAVLLVVAAQSCHAQQTQVQATVVDPIGNAYQFLTGSASINCPGNQAPLYNGFTVPRNYPITGADGNGHFVLTLYDVNAITPAGCSYNFAITYKDGVTSFIATSIGASGSATPITGAGPVNLSTPINAFAVLLPGSITGNLSGMTAGQVPIAASAITVTSSKPIQGTDANLLSSGTVSGTASPLCTDASGGATTTGCPSTSGGVSGTGGQSAYFSGSNAVTGGTVALDMKGISGADLGAIMNTCASSLPAAGGVCRGENLSGALTLSTAVTTAKPVVYTFCGQSISQSANVALANVKSAVVGCPGGNTTFTKAGNIDQFTMSAGPTSISWIALSGASGSFTGNGINSSAAGSGSDVTHVTIGNEASSALVVGASLLADFNVLSGTSSSPVLTGGGQNSKILGNIITQSGAADGLDLTASGGSAAYNSVTISPPPGTSGKCAINIIGDILGANASFNFANVADTNSGNVNNGLCMTGVSGHMYENVAYGNTCSPILAGGAQAVCYLYDNTAGVNPEGSENRWRDNTCTHETVCLKRIDSTGQTNYYSEFATNNGGFTGGSTGDVVEETVTPFTFATLPIAGNGSRVTCTNCASGRVAQAGAGGPSTLTFTSGKWIGLSFPTWAFIQAVQHAASATNTSIAFTNHNVPGNSIITAIQCTATGSPTLTVSDTANGTYTQDFAPVSDGANHWIALYRINNIAGGANTVSVSSAGNTCTYVNIVAAAEYSGIAGPDGAGTSGTGTGTAVASGSFAVSQYDLVVGIATNVSGSINPGTGCGGGWACRPGSGDFESIFEDQVGASSGTANATATANTSNPWVALGFAYKLAP